MNTCGTCKHWGNDRDRDEKYKRCLAVIHDKHSYYGEGGEDWLSEEPTDDWEREKRDEVIAIRKHKAVAVDGSGYFAALKVREDFGCVLHEDNQRLVK